MNDNASIQNCKTAYLGWLFALACKSDRDN